MARGAEARAAINNNSRRRNNYLRTAGRAVSVVTMSNDILRHGLGLRIGIYSNDMNVRKTSKPRKADHAADKANPQASKAIRKALLNADTGHPSCHPHHAKLQSTASVSPASRHNCKKFRGGRRPRNILHLPSRGSLADLTIKSR
jgi:hypothetical protein